MARRLLGRAILDAVGAIPLFLTAPLVRRWHLHWGATDEEVRSAMPGDGLITRPRFTATRAISVRACAADVWPWIVQMGYRRAGFYTYALLDNAGHDSADTILPQYQDACCGASGTGPNGRSPELDLVRGRRASPAVRTAHPRRHRSSRRHPPPRPSGSRARW